MFLVSSVHMCQGTLISAYIDGQQVRVYGKRAGLCANNVGK